MKLANCFTDDILQALSLGISENMLKSLKKNAETCTDQVQCGYCHKRASAVSEPHPSNRLKLRQYAERVGRSTILFECTSLHLNIRNLDVPNG